MTLNLPTDFRQLFRRVFFLTSTILLILTFICSGSHSLACEQIQPEDGSQAEVQQVKLPGITIDIENKRVDIAGSISLDEGLLELIACTKDSKEHESLVMIDAVPMHVHAALLLIGAENGQPAAVKPANEEKTQWMHLPPSGDPVVVSLVYTDPKDGAKVIERRISDFLKRADRQQDVDEQEREQMPDPATVFETFLFSGSIVGQNPDGQKHYMADQSGNVVSISTFGDEVLCLPSRQSQDNHALEWAVNNTHLPKPGTKVTLRLTLAPKQIQNQDEAAQ